jgi:LacI family transcriptional regulator
LPTIRDVARLAEVAPITVSRVVNRVGYVGEETRARVEQAIAELGYVPNRLARSLRSKQTHTLGLIITDITNPFWTTVARGAEDAARQAGFNMILCNSDESLDKQAEYIRVLLQKQIDGFLLVPAHSAPESLQSIRQQNVPVVALDRTVEASVDTVRCDSEGGALALTRYLLELGHRDIAMLSGSPEVSTATERVAGYRRAMEKAGFVMQEGLILYGEFTQASGRDMTRRILARSLRPTAIFAANNFIAIGVLQMLKEKGLQVPSAISVVTFDDLPASLVIDPFLTVAAQPAYEMGQRATELLLSRITGALTDQPVEILLPAPLIIRRSAAAPSACLH